MSWFHRLISAILVFFIYSPSVKIAPYSVEPEKNVKTVFTVLADVHLESNNRERFKWTGDGLRDVNAAEEPSRALVFVGDNTMNGNPPETAMFFGFLRKYNKIENVLIAPGNHDLCSRDQTYEKYEKHIKRLVKHNNIFLSNKIDEKMYYSRIIDGYRFIILSSEHDAGVNQYLSEEQFAWLEEELKQAETEGKPVFLFSHWPLNNAFSDGGSDSHVGEQSDRLLELLKKYDNRIFFFTGHLHMGMSQNDYQIQNDGELTYINVPAFGAINNDWGDETALTEAGMGYNVQVYEDKVVVRTRNYVKHEWTDFEYTFDV